MMKFLREIPEAPAKNADDRRRSQLLYILLIGVGGITAFALIGLTVSSITGLFHEPILYIGIFAMLFGIASSLWLNRLGQVAYAGILFLALITLVFAFVDNPVETIKGRTLFMFVIPILISSFIVRPYASFIATGAVALLHISIATFTPVKDYTPIGLGGFAVIALVAWLAARNLENALNDLQKVNQELDQRVVERTKELARANDQLKEQAMELASANLQLEEQAHSLEKANERLQGLDQLKSKFVSDVSHELRTPISNLAIYLEMIETATPENHERYLNVLRDETARLRKLVNDILDLSRMERGTIKVEYRWVEINNVVEKVVTANRLRAEAKGVSISLEPAADLPKLWADQNQLNQAITNIVGNAVNYTPQGSIQVKTFLDRAAGKICLTVQDTGLGIEPADIPHLFERFYRGKQAGQSSIPGTGLGLAITKELIESLQGSIEVESQVGVGTTFKIGLPIRQQDNPTQPAIIG